MYLSSEKFQKFVSKDKLTFSSIFSINTGHPLLLEKVQLINTTNNIEHINKNLKKKLYCPYNKHLEKTQKNQIWNHYKKLVEESDNIKHTCGLKNSHIHCFWCGYQIESHTSGTKEVHLLY